MTSYYLSYRGKALSYWYPNANFYGQVKDIIGFSTKNYFTFDTKEQAHEKLKLMFKDHAGMEGDLKISIRIFRILEKIRVEERKL